MKITFLGTSAGIPDPDRHCSSTMIEVGERVYIVDAGAPMVDCLRTQGLLMERENAERIAAVFATASAPEEPRVLITGFLQPSMMPPPRELKS